MIGLLIELGRIFLFDLTREVIKAVVNHFAAAKSAVKRRRKSRKEG